MFSIFNEINLKFHKKLYEPYVDNKRSQIIYHEILKKRLRRNIKNLKF